MLVFNIYKLYKCKNKKYIEISTIVKFTKSSFILILLYKKFKNIHLSEHPKL